MHRIPSAYVASITELIRRRDYNDFLSSKILKFMEAITKFRLLEEKRRDNFMKEIGRYLPPHSVRGLDEKPPLVDMTVSESFLPAVDKESITELGAFIRQLKADLGDTPSVSKLEVTLMKMSEGLGGSLLEREFERCIVKCGVVGALSRRSSRDSIHAAETPVAMVVERMQAVEAERNGLLQDRGRLLQELDELRDEVDRRNRDSGAGSQDRGELRQRNEDAVDNIRQNFEKDKLITSLTASVKHLELVNNQLSNNATRTQVTVRDLHQQLEQAHESRKSFLVEQEKSESEKELVWEATVQRLQSELESLHEEHAALKAEFLNEKEDKKSRVASQGRQLMDLKEVQAQNDALKDETADYKALLRTARITQAEYQEKIQELQDENSTFKTQIAESVCQNKDLDLEKKIVVTRLSREKEDVESGLKKLNERVRVADMLIESLRKESDDARGEAERRRNEITVIRGDVAKYAHEKSDLGVVVERCHGEILDLRQVCIG